MARIAEMKQELTSHQALNKTGQLGRSAKIHFWTNFWSLYLAIIYAWPKSLLELDDCF